MKKLAMTMVVLTTSALSAGLISAAPATAAQAVASYACTPAPAPAKTPSKPRAITRAGSTTPPTAAATKPTKLTRAQKAEIVTTARALSKPSKWRGEPLVHPTKRVFPQSVKRWANLVSAVMAEHGIPSKFLVGILAQLQQESWGDPNSIYLDDSNCRRGTPSMGLMQVIAPTYLTHAKPGLKNVKFQMLPYANVWAALKYAKSRYGMSKFASWNSGYNQGY